MAFFGSPAHARSHRVPLNCARMSRFVKPAGRARRPSGS
jgi:hypothetical protein